MAGWSAKDLAQVERAEELEITTTRADGTVRHAVPIWVVRVGQSMYVRTWHRRDTGWFGHVMRSGQAHIRVPGLEREVAVEDLGGVDPDLRAQVDAPYRAKYGRYGAATVDRMIGDDAAAATLRLVPAGPS